MEVKDDDWTSAHTIPNAFMASTRHHPLWLFPLSNVLRRYGADDFGHLNQTETAWWKSIVEELPGQQEDTEKITGPVALYNAVKAYREWKNATSGLDQEPFFPTLIEHAKLAPDSHEVVVFNSATIYPFSWATEDPYGKVYKHCRAAPGLDFDAIQCQGE